MRPPLRREPPPGAYSAIPCWRSAEDWLEHVTRVYTRTYPLLRPQLVAATGGGVSLAAVLATAAAQAANADHRTGRDSHPSVANMAAAARLGERTVQRARLWLRLAGLATEVQPGRHRTLEERIASWQREDRARGWTAVYALHPSHTHPDPTNNPPPVDNPRRVWPAQPVDGTPPRSGSVTPISSVDQRVSTAASSGKHPPPGKKDGATRRAPTRNPAQPEPTRLRTPATALMLAWRTEPTCPQWAKAYGAHRWSGALTAPANAGWTARDLTQLLTDLNARGYHVLTHPRRPIAYLLSLLTKVDLAEPPTRQHDAQAAATRAAQAQQAAERATQRAENERARHTAIAALDGEGRRAVYQLLDTIAQRAGAGEASPEAPRRHHRAGKATLSG